MRFLVDECVGPAVADWLRQQGYEIFSVFDEARGLDDGGIIQKAFAENWVLITTDKDFGEKIYRERHLHHGVILLRLDDERYLTKIAVIRSLIDHYSEHLVDNYLVATEQRVRFAKQ
jgi:predicted nuclease of predicted toxin-antitoxin system